MQEGDNKTAMTQQRQGNGNRGQRDREKRH